MFVKLLNQFEKVLFTLTLFLCTDNFIIYISFLSRQLYVWQAVHFLTGTRLNQVGNAVRTWSGAILPLFLEAAFWFVVLTLIARHGLLVKVLKMILNNVGVVALFLLACASWFWSVNPSATLGGLYLVLKITLIGIYLSQRYSPEENLNLLVGVIALASLFSILAIWATPEWSLHPGGEWRGIYEGKNFLGRLMTFGNAIIIIYWFKNLKNLREAVKSVFHLHSSSPSAQFTEQVEELSLRQALKIIVKQIFAFGLFILTGILIVFSRSTTSLLILLGIYAVFIMYVAWSKWGARLGVRMRSALVILGIAALITLVWNNAIILGLFNKTATLTGRTALWEILWTWFQKRPVFGFGYEAFWSQFSNGIWPSGPGWVDAPARHAHNGYIEIVLGLGLVGLILFLPALLLSWKRAITLLLQKKQLIFLWPLSALIYLTFSNITYSVAFGFPGFHWALFILAAGLVTPGVLEESNELDAITI